MKKRKIKKIKKTTRREKRIARKSGAKKKNTRRFKKFTKAVKKVFILKKKSARVSGKDKIINKTYPEVNDISSRQSVRDVDVVKLAEKSSVENIEARSFAIIDDPFEAVIIEEAPQDIESLIRVMPQLSIESLNNICLIVDNDSVYTDTLPVILSENIKEEGIEASVPEMIVVSTQTKEDAGIKEEDVLGEELLETSFPSKPPKIHVVKELTFVQVGNFIFWPVIRVYGTIYWRMKLHFVKKRNAKQKKNGKNNKSDDVFSEEVTDDKKVKFLNKSLRKFGISLVAISILIVFPIVSAFWYQRVSLVKEKVLENSQVAIESLRKGEDSIKNLDLAQAAKNFENSKKYFEKAQNEFLGLSAISRAVVQKLPRTGDNIKAGFVLLEAGKNIAEAGEKLSLATHSLLFEPSYTQEGVLESFVSKLAILEENLNFAIPKIAQAKVRIEGIDTDTISLSNVDTLNAVKNTLPTLESDLVDMSAVISSLLNILGYNEWQRYLLIFENSNEMRATGGFMGSFALVDVNGGKIENLEIPPGGSYDLQGSLTATVNSPEPLHLINPIWQFQDSNWWPDFPTSAKKISWFYEKSQGPSVDGVVAITSDLVEKIINVVGPIEMEKYNRVITAQNFVEETQKIVELEYDKVENKPKQFIADLAPQIFDGISKLDNEGTQKLFSVLYEGLKERHLILYSYNEDIQKMIMDLDWGGIQKEVISGDYISVIHSNIAGGKTDGVIKDSIDHVADILDDGSIINTLSITRAHSGSKEDIFSGVQNNSYTRIYVPKGSVLISAQGFTRPSPELFEDSYPGYEKDNDLARIESEHFTEPDSETEIYNENGKTVFANWIMVKPGETKTVVLKYRLEQSVQDMNSVYTLTAQKQAGSEGSAFHSSVLFPSRFFIKETYPKLNSSDKISLQQDGTLEYSDMLKIDRFYGVVFNESSN